MALFDSLKKNVSDLSRTSETVVKKSGGMLELQKAKMQKAVLEGKLKDLYAKAGEFYVKNTPAGEVPEEMKELTGQIEECLKAIEEGAARISQLRGVVICPGCGAEVDADNSFCPKCGAKLEKPEPENVQAEVDEEDCQPQADEADQDEDIVSDAEPETAEQDEDMVTESDAAAAESEETPAQEDAAAPEEAPAQEDAAAPEE